MSRDPLDSEQRDLAESYIPFARSIAVLRAAVCPGLADDIHGAALLGLSQAAKRWRGSAGVKFATYAALRIEGEISDTMRRERPIGYRNANTRGDIPETVALPPDPGLVVDARPPGSGLDDSDAWDRLTEGCAPEARRVLTLVYRDGLQQYEVAKKMGMTRPTVCRRHASGLDQCRKDLAAREAGPGVGTAGREGRPWDRCRPKA